MTTIKTIHRALAALSLPRPVPALLTVASRIVTAMTGNPSFSTPTPTLAAVTTAITALHTAQTAALARTHGAALTRDEKRTTLVTLLQQLRGYVQATADANMENGASVIASAGLAVKKTAAHAPRTFSAKQGKVSGSAAIIAVSAGRRASYEWQYSTDGGKTWVTAPATLQARTTVVGLTPGVTVEFRYRPVTKTGEGDWSQTVALLVK